MAEAAEGKQAARGRRLLRVLTSVPVLTLLILCFVDIWLRQGNMLDALGFHTVDVWNIPPRIELAERTNPDVALVGSSLLLVLNQDEHGSNFYSGIYPPLFQSRLRAETGERVTCINLCTGLQMPSEAYLIAEALADNPRREYPPVVIYGLALRDFIHDQYAREWTCDSFASIAPYAPLSGDVLSAMTSPHALQEFILSHSWYLYRNRTDFKGLFSALTKDALELLPLDLPFMRLGRDHQWRPQKEGFLWETWVPRQQEKFTESIYKTRPEFLKFYFGNMQAAIYRQGSESTMRIQTHYLERLIGVCKRNGIKLVLVNMPLSPEFQALVPGGLYDAFRSFLSNIARQDGVALIDLYADKDFDASAFKDGVHLSYKGAVALADKLTVELREKYPDILEAVSAHARARQLLSSTREMEAPYGP